MSDLFIDGVRSIAVANGVARIELVQLQRSQNQKALEPNVVATMMIPVAALRELSNQLANTVDRLSEAAKVKRADATAEAVDTALENL